MLAPPPTFTPLPYTTLFRSPPTAECSRDRVARERESRRMPTGLPTSPQKYLEKEIRREAGEASVPAPHRGRSSLPFHEFERYHAPSPILQRCCKQSTTKVLQPPSEAGARVANQR